MTQYKTIDSALIEWVLGEARASPRRRRHFNFHDSEQHPCQRLINAVLPDAYAVAFEPSVVFEAKAGPYVPHTRDETAGFAPAEGSPGAAAYMTRLKHLFDHA